MHEKSAPPFPPPALPSDRLVSNACLVGAKADVFPPGIVGMRGLYCHTTVKLSYDYGRA